MSQLKIFRYIDELDAFVADEPYRQIADELGLTEWTPVVWIGRLFIMDNDFGEHWFDNWDLREQKKAEAEALGFRYDTLLIIDPNRFQDGKDGPCNTPEIRKRFWTDVLKSLTLSYDLIFDQARKNNEQMKGINDDAYYIVDLEDRIVKIQQSLIDL